MVVYQGLARGENFSMHVRKLACKLVANALFAGVCQICTRVNLELVLGGKPIAKAVIANYANVQTIANRYAIIQICKRFASRANPLKAFSLQLIFASC